MAASRSVQCISPIARARNGVPEGVVALSPEDDPVVARGKVHTEASHPVRLGPGVDRSAANLVVTGAAGVNAHGRRAYVDAHLAEAPAIPGHHAAQGFRLARCGREEGEKGCQKQRETKGAAL